MASPVYIMRALFRAGETAHAVKLAQAIEALAPAGEQLVNVSLVARVPDELVFGGVEDVMQGECELDYAEVARQVPAGSRYVVDKEVADLLS